MSSNQPHELSSLVSNNSGHNKDDYTIQVDIFVARHCFICEFAYEIVELIERNFSQVDLRVIDIADPEETIPDSVFATPTYLLNGRVWCLGNPSPTQVVQKLNELLPQTH